MAVDEEDLRVRVEGRVGCITLTRGKVLNAVNRTIVDRMTEVLGAWAEDPAIAMVLIDADSEKAFSAGGDLTAMYHYGKSGDYQSGNDFWRDEYRLNAMIDRFPKPYVPFMDGIVMGGGVGISAHGSHRIVTEHSVVAMPECAIGLIPDVGGSYLLRQAPGRLGEYLGLTGTRMNGADAVYARFADHYVPRERLPELKARLIETGDVDAIGHFEIPAPASVLETRLLDVARIFSGPTVEAIRDVLAEEEAEWAVKAHEAIVKASPISLFCTLWAVRAAKTLPEALRNEYRFVSRVLEHGDFVEGIRAVIIDKDRNPQWRYTSLEAVPQCVLCQMVAETEGGDPDFG
ncbi:enoyl-CoA hydratase/isomerase family protein [Rhizobium sp. SL86]|uniref:enoyl-CoA hydratase/isomerase family protein n=1 Tax=Rhizobium sp. SL86 TaxID=2995148 RepID=UPI0022736181|nr:enoyl-CoA hydratase/isomerase family protein [Rhizobium sp. SL86]MCY1667082.1 enoyl-CoA hydratase/isomerase family protein [Rhizobium sp. SL86]